MRIMLGIGVLLMGLVGCTTVHELGGGRYVVPRTAEVRSPFGTNMGWTKLENCEGKYVNNGPDLEYRDCYGLTDWTPMSSQGQGGQITAGALQGIGLGVLGAVMPANGGASAVQSQVQTVAPAARGHH